MQLKIQSLITVLLLSCIATLLHAQDRVGKIEFKPFGEGIAQPYFQKGLILLHSFEYEFAIEQFKMAQLLDPNFVMAVWGEAMCYNKPMCQIEEYEKGKGALLKLGIFEEDRINLPKNELEKGFLIAAEALYRENEPRAKREEAYFNAMKDLYEKFPDENEVLSFYALVIMEKSQKASDPELSEKVIQLCNEILSKNPNHPGALHYSILIQDNPKQARSALEPAKKFPQTTVATAYTLHIPSHIYSAVGQWDKMVKANEQAWKTADERVVKNKLSLEERGYHFFWWLEYGYLQQGKYAEAESMVKEMYQDARLSQSAKTRHHLILMQTAYLVESNNWQSPVAGYDVPTNKLNITIKMAELLVEGLKAYQNSEMTRLNWVSERMTDQLTIERNKGHISSGQPQSACCSEFVNPPVSQADINLSEVMELEVKALEALTKGNDDEAIEFMDKACELEMKSQMTSGPPVIVKPALELYGEILVKLGQPEKAVEIFNKALGRYPNRTASLIGKYKALKYSGQSTEAVKVKMQVLNNWKEADAEVRSGLD